MDHDLCVIGAGWAGFNAALTAARMGKSVCLVEEKEVGGTCLNRGCIPTKALLAYAKQGLPLNEIQKKKSCVVARLRQGMTHLLETHKVDYAVGRGFLEGDGTVSVPGRAPIKSRFVLLATGSEPKELPGISFDHKKILSSDDVFGLVELPERLLIIGGGVIGCEFASFFRKMGVAVTVLEATAQLIPGFDLQVSKKLEQAFDKQGIVVRCGAETDVSEFGNFDKVLLAVGRKSIAAGFWADGAGIKLERETIGVDRELKTGARSVFAAGDCIGGYMLAHIAGYEGELAVRNMFGKAEKRDYRVVPSSVFTTPEVSTIGVSEEEAKKFGVAYTSRTVHYLSIGMAHVQEETQGFVKVIVDEETRRIIGAHAIGLQAAELVNMFSVTMKNNISIEALGKTIFAHPSISEIVAEVARSFAVC